MCAGFEDHETRCMPSPGEKIAKCGISSTSVFSQSIYPPETGWVHVGEGLTVFNIMGLSDPNSPKFQKRVRRFAGFYTGEDPSAANYDPKHKVIRSMFNGSRAPLLRPATSVDWAGQYIDD